MHEVGSAETLGTKERLIQAAGPIFARSGFAEGTVREICEAAGANLAAVNYHFGDKWGLYVATLEEAHVRMNELVPAMEESPELSAEEQFGLFVRTTLLRMINGPKTGWPSELLMREVLAPSAACDVLIQRCVRPHFERLLEIISSLLQRNVERRELEHLGFAVISQCFHYRMCGPFMKRITESSSTDPAMEIGERGLEDAIAFVTRFSLVAFRNWGSDDSHRGVVTSLSTDSSREV